MSGCGSCAGGDILPVTFSLSLPRSASRWRCVLDCYASWLVSLWIVVSWAGHCWGRSLCAILSVLVVARITLEGNALRSSFIRFALSCGPIACYSGTPSAFSGLLASMAVVLRSTCFLAREGLRCARRVLKVAIRRALSFLCYVFLSCRSCDAEASGVDAARSIFPRCGKFCSTWHATDCRAVASA